MMQNNLKIKQLPISERPYEKCMESGPSSLSDAELLAVIIKSGTQNLKSTDVAHLVLNLCEKKGGLYAMHSLTQQELKKIPGIGTVKAIQIQCAAELATRISRSVMAERQTFTKPDQVAAYYMEQLRYKQQEHLILMMLDTKNRLIKDMILSKGTVNYTIIQPRDIFIQALKCEAVHLILIHNHPSGDPTPSDDDIRMTCAVSELGNMIGIPLLDHIIIGDHCFETLSAYINDATI